MKKLNFRNAIKADPEFEGNPDLDSPEFKIQFDKVLEKLRFSPEVEDLSLKSNWIKAKQLNQLAEILSTHHELQDLDLSYNRLAPESVSAIKKIINDHPKLKIVYLDFNDLTDEFIAALIEENSEEFNQRLRSVELSLSNNNFLTVKSIDDTESRLHNDSRLAMLVGNHITIAVASEYRKKIMKQAEQAVNLGRSVSSPIQAVASEVIQAASAPFTPLKDARVTSPNGKSSNQDKREGFEECKESGQNNLESDFKKSLSIQTMSPKNP